jgi:hypothetical protein
VASAYGSGAFVVAGWANDGIYFAVSQDSGASWFTQRWAPTELAINPNFGSVNSIVYANGKFVAAGYKWTTSGNGELRPCVWTSANGVVWSDPVQLPTPAGDDNWPSGPTTGISQAHGNHVVWAPSASKFVVTVSNANVPDVVYFSTSANGTSGWVTTSLSANRGPDVWVYGGLAAGPSSIAYLSYDGYPFTSPDGSTWTARTRVAQTPVGDYYLLGYGAGKFLWPGEGNRVPYYSSNNGVTWLEGSAQLEHVDEYSFSMSYDGSYFHMGGSGTNDGFTTWHPKFARSADGLTWTETFYPGLGLNYFIQCVASNQL